MDTPTQPFKHIQFTVLSEIAIISLISQSAARYLYLRRTMDLRGIAKLKIGAAYQLSPNRGIRYS